MKTNPEAVYHVMTSPGDVDSLLYFSELMSDFDAVVTLHVQQEYNEEALKVMKMQVYCRFVFLRADT